MVCMMVRVENMRQFPAVGPQGGFDRPDIRCVDGGCHVGFRVVDQITVIVAQARNLMDL